jgi:hypothetical protein
MKNQLLFVLLLTANTLHAQKSTDPLYVDKQGVFRWTKDRSEAAFFGVNYTVPFAYGYRSHKALGIDPEKAIDADVHHMARLGLDAFRVHVWDVEISDSAGNLLDNEHLRLFDYLIKKLEEKNIKIIITPIAFWGNGYPEPDIKTNGFSYVYGKGQCVVKEEAFRAQENYLRQFFNHVNPYTNLSYKADPGVIAMEINNEPHHSGPKERATEYINRMAAAVRSTGWTKPVFYNISESPAYADAVVKANVDGYSFQWYPTNLVANHEQKGNFLLNVDAYLIPFADSIPGFNKGARMVYEFDAGDVMQPIMYPAMARSYRTAGFQWATQFAYDPMYTAYANTEYQTHYLNLLYTPAKAISLLIASKVFHNVPRGKTFGAYPADTLFDGFRVSYKEQLSEMNSDEAFYYSNSTKTTPLKTDKLKHIAGVGNSPVVQYEGTGAYFLDKINKGVWRLEVMPDAVTVNDPFGKASPKKEVVKLNWQPNSIRVDLSELRDGFELRSIPASAGAENSFTNIPAGEKFIVTPGIYYLVAKGTSFETSKKTEPFYIPSFSATEPYVVHEPVKEVTAKAPFQIFATIVGADTSCKISVEMRNASNVWRTVPMKQVAGYRYSAEVPVELVTPGVINYRIMLRKPNGDSYTFPGGFKGNPYAWDEYRNESWQVFVADPKSPLELFNATADRTKLVWYNTDWRNNRIEAIAVEDPGQLAVKASMMRPAGGQSLAFHYFFGHRISGRKNELSAFTKLVVRARSAEDSPAMISLIDVNGNAFSSKLMLSKEWKEIAIPLTSFVKDSSLLLPRPYPGFQRLWFVTAGNAPMNIADTEKIEIRFSANVAAQSANIEVQWVRLRQ